MAELTPFDAELGLEQGRLTPPTNFVPTDGESAYVLGTDLPGTERLVRLGDRVELTQNADLTVGTKLLRYSAKLVPPARMPLEAVNSPYNLVSGDELQVSVDGGAAQTVQFLNSHFVNIATARAYEVSARINEVLTGATASSPDLSVQIVSDSEGLGSSIEIVGGSAAPKLAFAGRAWEASLLVGGVKYVSQILNPGSAREVNLAANVSDVGSTVDITFRLELVLA